jgi:hypothetical protein
VASDLLFAEVFSATDRILWYQKGNPHRRIAETTIALDASLHSTVKLSTGKLSTGKLSTGKLSTGKLSTGKLSTGKRAFVKVHKFFPMGFGSTSQSHLIPGRSQILTF